MEKRGTFGSKLAIVLATAGSAVGLGNIWRFPFMAGHNGGAAFILVYFACVLLLGIPGMVGEFIIGRHSQSNSARAYAMMAGRRWRFVGYLGILTIYGAGPARIVYLTEDCYATLLRVHFIGEAVGFIFCLPWKKPLMEERRGTKKSAKAID